MAVVPFTKANRHLTLGILLMVLGLMLAFAGWQAWMVDKAAEQRANDRAAYARCLGDWGQRLVEAVRQRTEATKELERAGDAKDRTLDRLLTVTEKARRHPPDATAADFDRALDARVAAQRRYERVKDELAQVRRENPYKAPEVVCSNGASAGH